MACNGCTVGEHGKPPGCKQNGTCANGGCNRMNVFDWLAGIPVAGELDTPAFVEVSFKNGARKIFFHNKNQLLLDLHETVVVEGTMGGYDVGVVSLTGEMARLQMKKKRIPENSPELCNVIRKANEFDLKKCEELRLLENETMIRARAIARQLNLEMKIGDVEFQGDGRKATFYYTADERVDFRELIRIYAKEFHVKIEMHQIGARQEAGRIGGLGSCGRELCCSTWLSDFKTVTTSAARYQQLSINQAKLSGQCGRLKCCLNYELDTYMDALQDFPVNIEKIETQAGVATLQKTDIFRRMMWFAYENSSVYRSLSVEKVKEFSAMNARGEKPAELIAVEPVTATEKVQEEFSDVVGQTSLQSLEKKKTDRKNRRHRKKNFQPSKDQKRR